jgi:hypothetical protein
VVADGADDADDLVVAIGPVADVDRLADWILAGEVATIGAWAVSRCEKRRPRRSGMPSVAKYAGLVTR